MENNNRNTDGTVKCFSCNGTGERLTKPGVVTTYHHKRLGTEPPKHYEKCPLCKGNGYWGVKKEEGGE